MFIKKKYRVRILIILRRRYYDSINCRVFPSFNETTDHVVLWRHTSQSSYTNINKASETDIKPYLFEPLWHDTPIVSIDDDENYMLSQSSSDNQDITDRNGEKMTHINWYVSTLIVLYM